MSITPAVAHDRTHLANAVAGASEPLLAIDLPLFRADFGERPFRIRHRLANHDLFALPRLVELASALPPASVEYNAGNVGVTQDPTKTPDTGLSAVETIRRIEECRSWMVLWHVEQDAEYEALLDACLHEVEVLGHPASKDIVQREGFIFITSPGSITPYHIDPEHNFLLQVRGKKTINVYDGGGDGVVSEEQLERFFAGAHRNQVYQEEHEKKGQAFELLPGDGVHVPTTYPHWVKNGDEVSISFSITFKTRATERRGLIYVVNNYLRGRGWQPRPVGKTAWRDDLKYNAYRVLRRLGAVKQSGMTAQMGAGTGGGMK